MLLLCVHFDGGKRDKGQAGYQVESPGNPPVFAPRLLGQAKLLPFRHASWRPACTLTWLHPTPGGVCQVFFVVAKTSRS